jgi:acyl-CoA thioesterase
MASVGAFDDETAVIEVAPGRFGARVEPAWNIGDNANGGYALSPVLRALAGLGHPDPLAVTTHFLRPLQPSADPADTAEVTVEVVRSGRTTTVARGTLAHRGRDRLTVLAAFGVLDPSAATDAEIEPSRPATPEPGECVDRSGLEQGVDLPILGRLDVRIHPGRAVAGGSDDAVMEGWIRFHDGTEPTALALALFADAFPPALYARFGRIGWVPTIELTVHVRRRPAPGWVQARFECDDLRDGRMIESGSLWDSTGALVARSRQLGLLLPA